MKKTLIVLTIILGITSIAHAFILPQATNCLLIDFHGFEKEGRLYYRAGLPDAKKKELNQLIQQAAFRVADFWDFKASDPKFIYCESLDDFKKFGTAFPAPAAAVMHIGSYVVFNDDGVDLDIISHELAHTELAARIGIWNRTMKIPVWFDEGLAMQVDHRSYYSIDTLRVLSNNFTDLPNVKSMVTYSEFGSGTREDVMMNYRTSKYEVFKWYTPEKLEDFVAKLNEGESFEEAYQ